MITHKQKKNKNRRNTQNNSRQRSFSKLPLPETAMRFAHQFIEDLRRMGNRSTYRFQHHRSGGKHSQTANHRTQRLEDARVLNRTKTLRTKLFEKDEYPKDFEVVRKYHSHLPSHMETVHDYQRWLDLKPLLSHKGKKRLKGLRDLAKEDFSSAVVKQSVPSPLPELKPELEEAPPAIAAVAYVPPHVTDELSTPTTGSPLKSTASVGSKHLRVSSKRNTNKSHDRSRTSTKQRNPLQKQPLSFSDDANAKTSTQRTSSAFAQQMNDTQLTHTPEEKAHYEQMALKEADQRQLLMLLCGDVEADMFFDNDGQMRGPRQIIEQTLFLLEPYQMSNSKVGVWAKHIYFYTNYVWKYGTTVAALVVSVMSLYHIGLFMMMCTRTLVETHSYSNLIKGFLNKSAFIFIGLYNTIITVLSRQFQISNTGAVFNGRVGQEFVRMLCVGGPPAMLWWFFTRTKVDYSNNEQLTVAMYCARTLHDRHKQLDAMNYLAQLTPGIFGDDLSSGITNGQLGAIAAMQDELLKLDKRVDEMTEDEYAAINVQYNKSGRGTGITEHKIDLANLLNRHFNTALKKQVDENTEPELVAFRKTLLTIFKDEMRCFHLLDAYGHPRDKVGICKAYFVYWQMCEQSQRLPTIPYEGQDTFVEYLKLTPLQQLRTKRKTMKSSKNIPNTWWRQHPFLYKNDKTPIDLQDALRTEPSDVLSLFDYGNQKSIRKHKGWTHRIAQIGKENAIDRFHLNTLLLSKEYDLIRRKTSSERKKALVNAEPIDTDKWNDDRDVNVFEGGVRLVSPESPKAFVPSQKPVK